jgi:TusA-related sulfurtransferase
MSSIKNRNMIQKTGEGKYFIDVTSLACPYPQLFALNALSEIPSGVELEVLLDNPPSVRDIPPALERKGYKVKDVSRIEGSYWKITVQV